MKQTKLYIFTTSDIPDPYINAIAHCAANYKELNQVTLIGITEDRGKVSSRRAELNRLEQNIDNQLDNLSKGRYLKKNSNKHEILDVLVEEADRQRYSGLRSLPRDIKVWVYQDLEQEISVLLASNTSTTYIFDVTTFLKSYLVDVYTVLKSKDVNAIHSFELFNKRSYDQNELIHNLIDGKTYIYACLTESLYTSNKIVALRDSIISRSDFDQLQLELEALKSTRNYLEDLASTYYAKFWSLVYFLLGLPFFLLSCWIIFKRDGWNWFEPVTFVITFGWFLLNYILQGFFAGQFPSLDPRESFNALRSWRKKGLEKSRLTNSNKL